MPDQEFETIAYEARDGVATVTLNRPERHNAFDVTMAKELHSLWRSLRRDDDVRCIVLTGAGDRAFCSGVDRHVALGSERGADRDDLVGFGSTHFMFNDPGQLVGPKTSDLWKPVVAAVNGMACAGAFYLLGEADFIIAADHATFFDPHVTFGMTAAFEPLQMLSKMPLQELLRMTLLGSHERMSAARAYQVGLVSEVVPYAELNAAAAWAAAVIAASPAAAIEGSLRAIWTGVEFGSRQALGLGYAFVGLGREGVDEGQARFEAGERIDWKVR